jgi:hypothetical protein
MKIAYSRTFENDEIISIGWLEYSTKEIKMQFKDFDELEEFLNNIELSDGYKIGLNQSGDGDEITIYRYKD